MFLILHIMSNCNKCIVNMLQCLSSTYSNWSSKSMTFVYYKGYSTQHTSVLLQGNKLVFSWHFAGFQYSFILLCIGYFQ